MPGQFQLSVDVLPREIAELAAVAAIRTALNFFLGREIREERAELARRRSEPADGPTGSGPLR